MSHCLLACFDIVMPSDFIFFFSKNSLKIVYISIFEKFLNKVPIFISFL